MENSGNRTKEREDRKMIKNNPSVGGDKRIDDLRAAFAHRGAWFYYLYKAGKAHGLDEQFAREAIFEAGADYTYKKYRPTDDIRIFAEDFVNPNVKLIFEMEPTVTDECMDVRFHYCPLVDAWQKMGIPEDEIEKLCDIAMCGDRGLTSMFPEFEMVLDGTIAEGKDNCHLIIRKKQK